MLVWKPKSDFCIIATRIYGIDRLSGSLASSLLQVLLFIYSIKRLIVEIYCSMIPSLGAGCFVFKFNGQPEGDKR